PLRRMLSCTGDCTISHPTAGAGRTTGAGGLAVDAAATPARDSTLGWDPAFDPGLGPGLEGFDIDGGSAWAARISTYCDAEVPAARTSGNLRVMRSLRSSNVCCPGGSSARNGVRPRDCPSIRISASVGCDCTNSTAVCDTAAGVRSSSVAM